MDKSVMVTGGAGYVGSVLVEQLVKAGFQVVAFDNLSQGHRQAVSSKAAFVEGDVRDTDTVEEVLKSFDISAVFHMAAASVIEKSLTDPGLFYSNNVVGGVSLLDAMRRAKVNKIVFSSTAAVYGEPKQVPITEDHELNPISPYGESKLMFEKILHWYHAAYGIKYIALRYFNAAGATDDVGEHHEPESHVIPLLLQTGLGQRDAFNICGNDYDTPDGTCIRDFVHVIDMAEAHICALRQLDSIGARAYNLGSGQGNSVQEVVRTAKQICGTDFRVAYTDRRPGDPAILVASADRAIRELEWKPVRQDLGVIIESAWSWTSRHPSGYEN